MSNYLADAYETYSSSAQAAQSCVRNVGAAVIPLFANQMVSILSHDLPVPVLMVDSTRGWAMPKLRH